METKFNLRVSKFIDLEEDCDSLIEHYKFFVEILKGELVISDAIFIAGFNKIRMEEDLFLNNCRNALATLPGNVYLGICFCFCTRFFLNL